MRNFFSGLLILLVAALSIQCEKKLTFTCDVDTTKTGYELAGAYDDCLVWNAQKTMTHIEKKDIDIRATKLPVLEFEGSYADMNAAENWIQPFYTIYTENMSAYPNAPASINGVIAAKFKAKDSVDAAFEFSNDEPQGICADVQQEVYDTVLNNILSKQEREKYLSQGKQLSFIPDDDLPPLDNTTNPVRSGSLWLPVDPAAKITRDGDKYYYEPWSLYVEFDDPEITDERLRGVRYCKLLSHQAVLSWMLEKSFEENPVLITPTETVCDGPSALEAGNGSCLLYFELAKSYYCSDFTGSGFTPANAQEKCETSPTYTNAKYSTSPCSARTAEIATYIPGYLGLTGICVIHCKAANEFIWNIYTENPEKSCEGYDFFTPEELGK
jgi:ABC-type amino acid transport substrate-binding protein